jgi:hypothetical protein
MRISEVRRWVALGLAGLAVAGCDPSMMPTQGSPARAKVTVAGRASASTAAARSSTPTAPSCC